MKTIGKKMKAIDPLEYAKEMEPFDPGGVLLQRMRIREKIGDLVMMDKDLQHLKSISSLRAKVLKVSKHPSPDPSIEEKRQRLQVGDIVSFHSTTPIGGGVPLDDYFYEYNPLFQFIHINEITTIDYNMMKDNSSDWAWALTEQDMQDIKSDIEQIRNQADTYTDRVAKRTTQSNLYSPTKTKLVTV